MVKVKNKKVTAKVMIKLSTLVSIGFMQAQRCLSDHPAPTPIKWKLVTLFSAVVEQQDKLEKLRIECLKKFAVLDDKGNFVPPEGTPNGASFEEGQEFLYNKEWDETLDIEIDLGVAPMQQNDFAKLTNLTTSHLIALKDLIVE